MVRSLSLTVTVRALVATESTLTSRSAGGATNTITPAVPVAAIVQLSNVDANVLVTGLATVPLADITHAERVLANVLVTGLTTVPLADIVQLSSVLANVDVTGFATVPDAAIVQFAKVLAKLPVTAPPDSRLAIQLAGSGRLSGTGGGILKTPIGMVIRR